MGCGKQWAEANHTFWLFWNNVHWQ